MFDGVWPTSATTRPATTEKGVERKVRKLQLALLAPGRPEWKPRRRMSVPLGAPCSNPIWQKYFRLTLPFSAVKGKTYPASSATSCMRLSIWPWGAFSVVVADMELSMAADCTSKFSKSLSNLSINWDTCNREGKKACHSELPRNRAQNPTRFYARTREFQHVSLTLDEGLI